MTTDTTTLDAYDLAKLADVAAPEDFDSAGARFLLKVRDDLTDWIENDGMPDGRTVEEIANYVVPKSSGATWAAFTDLEGWQIDTTDLTGDRISARALTEHAQTVLFLIAERLLAALLAS